MLTFAQKYHNLVMGTSLAVFISLIGEVFKKCINKFEIFKSLKRGNI